MKAIHLQVDYLTEPLGLGNPKPRFYWNAEGGITQTAYQIVCKREGKTIWDSGRVESASMTHIPYEGWDLHSRDLVTWSVQLWDETGVHLGDWMEPEPFKDTVYGAKARHPEECTAYLHLTMTTMAEIAELLGENGEDYRKAAGRAKAAYPKYAELDTDRQAKLVRPLALGLLDGEEKKKAQTRLVKAVENFNHRVGTGFLSTPFLLDELTKAGAAETAYKQLLNTEKPGWLYEVLQGATTIWETWEGYTGSGDAGSLNHYSPGAVCQWLFDTCAGIRAEGENHFVIAPIPGGELTHAEASYMSPYGEVILFSNKMLHFIGKASRKTRCQFCALGHKTRLMQSPTRLRRYKTLL